MTSIGNLELENYIIELEEANISGIYEPHGEMTWDIEIFPPGEDTYIMFNALILTGIYTPEKISNTFYKATTDTADLYGHTVLLNGEDRFLQSVDMIFGKWDTTLQLLPLQGHGIINADDNQPAITFNFKTNLKFKELNIFETTREEAQLFVETHLQDHKTDIVINYEQVASGLQATITGHF